MRVGLKNLNKALFIRQESSCGTQNLLYVLGSVLSNYWNFLFACVAVRPMIFIFSNFFRQYKFNDEEFKCRVLCTQTNAAAASTTLRAHHLKLNKIFAVGLVWWSMNNKNWYGIIICQIQMIQQRHRHTYERYTDTKEMIKILTSNDRLTFEKNAGYYFRT